MSTKLYSFTLVILLLQRTHDNHIVCRQSTANLQEQLSQSFVLPPIGTLEDVQPEYGSSAIVISNSLYYIFRGMLSMRLKKHCQNLLKFPLLFSEFNPKSFFYLWPIYFSTFHLGNFYAVLYFLLSFTVEFLTITISLQCLIETIVNEWKWAKREIVTVIIIIFGVLHKIFTHFRVRLLLYVYSVSVATMFEALVLYGAYPIGRLVDDITFFYGVRPTTFRVLNMQIVPIFYTLKMYGMFKGFFKIIDMTSWAGRAPYYLLILYLMSVPFIVGAIYAIIKGVYIDKKSFKCLFKPIPEWGPEDKALRHLRKQYDSRYYVDSQAPRKLSRYIIQKSSLESYKLDVKYDNYLRRSSATTPEIRTEDEKKRK